MTINDKLWLGLTNAQQQCALNKFGQQLYPLNYQTTQNLSQPVAENNDQLLLLTEEEE